MIIYDSPKQLIQILEKGESPNIAVSRPCKLEFKRLLFGKAVIQKPSTG